MDPDLRQDDNPTTEKSRHVGPGLPRAFCARHKVIAYNRAKYTLRSKVTFAQGEESNFSRRNGVLYL